MGHGRGGRMKIEKDHAEIWCGVRHGKTLASPVGILIKNLHCGNLKDTLDKDEIKNLKN